MNVRASCVPRDRLMALAVVPDAPQSDHDRQLLAHVAGCDACATHLAQLTAEMDSLREAAWREADAMFDDAALDTQRTKILDRLAHLGKAARVLRFPARVREGAMPVSPVSRRWISVAAAAGLIIGLLAGQLIHFVPWDTRLHRVTPGSTASVSRPSASVPMIIQASAGSGPSDDELLDEVDQAVQSSRAASLRALDAFTPRVGEFIENR